VYHRKTGFQVSFAHLFSRYRRTDDDGRVARVDHEPGAPPPARREHARGAELVGARSVCYAAAVRIELRLLTVLLVGMAALPAAADRRFGEPNDARMPRLGLEAGTKLAPANADVTPRVDGTTQDRSPSAPDTAPVPLPESATEPSTQDGAGTAEPADTPAPALAEGRRAKRFRRALRKLLRRSPLGGVALSLVVAEVGSDQEIARVNPNGRRNPASTLKLITSAAALDALGPRHRFTTELLTHRDVIVLRGDGDPMFFTDDLERLVSSATLGPAGRRRVLVDATAFPGRDLPPGFEAKNTDSSYRASTGAVALNYGSVLVTVRPGRRGKKPRVTLEPPGDYLDIVNRARTVVGKGSTIRIAVNDRGTRSRLVVTGRIGVRRKRGSVARRRYASPPLAAGHALAALLRKRGFTIADVSLGATPSGAERVGRHRSDPLSELVAAMNKHSNNFIAEMMLRAIGQRAGGGWKHGIRWVEGWLARAASVRAGFRYRNGSGLYDGGGFSARQVVTLLKTMDKHRHRSAYRMSLAASGGEGTLKGRLKGPRYKGKIIGKTGTLNDVSALSGYARGASGKLYAFSILMNRTNKATVAMRGIQDRIAALIVDTL